MGLFNRNKRSESVPAIEQPKPRALEDMSREELLAAMQKTAGVTQEPDVLKKDELNQAVRTLQVHQASLNNAARMKYQEFIKEEGIIAIPIFTYDPRSGFAVRWEIEQGPKPDQQS